MRHLANGDDGPVLDSVFNLLELYPNFVIETVNVGRGNYGGEDLAIDSRTGEVYTEFKAATQLCHTHVHSEGEMSLGSLRAGKHSPLKLVFDGTEASGSTLEAGCMLIEDKVPIGKDDALNRLSVGQISIKEAYLSFFNLLNKDIALMGEDCNHEEDCTLDH